MFLKRIIIPLLFFYKELAFVTLHKPYKHNRQLLRTFLHYAKELRVICNFPKVPVVFLLFMFFSSKKHPSLHI